MSFFKHSAKFTAIFTHKGIIILSGIYDILLLFAEFRLY